VYIAGYATELCHKVYSISCMYACIVHKGFSSQGRLLYCMNAVLHVDMLVVSSLNQEYMYTLRSPKNFARRGNVHPGVVWLNVRFRNLAALYDKRISLASGLAEDCCAIECQVKGVG